MLLPGLDHAWLAASPLLALAMDRWLGEPPARWHPVVWMGAWLRHTGRRVAPREAQSRQPAWVFIHGAWWWTLGALCVALLAWLLQAALLTLPAWLAAVLLGALFKPLLSWGMLRQEALAVMATLAHSLSAARQRLRSLVSRDTAQLGAAQVRSSVIESVSENLNDSVVATLFWFALLGLPGAALFRYANTADAMWGYPGMHELDGELRDWQWAGKWAARVDDVLAWIPARLTAVLTFLLAGRGLPWTDLRTQASQPASPNSGWPMAAMAMVLDSCLSKPGAYTLHPQGHAPDQRACEQALAIAGRVVLATGLICALCMLLIGAWR